MLLWIQCERIFSARSPQRMRYMCIYVCVWKCVHLAVTFFFWVMHMVFISRRRRVINLQIGHFFFCSCLQFSGLFMILLWSRRKMWLEPQKLNVSRKVAIVYFNVHMISILQLYTPPPMLAVTAWAPEPAHATGCAACCVLHPMCWSVF